VHARRRVWLSLRTKAWHEDLDTGYRVALSMLRGYPRSFFVCARLTASAARVRRGARA
jgi:hypothetical protein